MSLSHVPRHVRAHLFLFRLGAVVGALGVIGFFLSYWEVARPELAAGDVYYDIPWFAYTSIFAWLGGLALMWYSRRYLRAAVERKLAENREAMYVDELRPERDAEPDSQSTEDALRSDTAVHAPDGR